MKEMTEAIAALNQKYERLSTSVQRMEAEYSNGRTNGGVQGGAPPPPPHNHEPEYNSGTGYNHEQRRGDSSIHTRALRPDFPRFDGGDPSGWLYRAEQFFEYHQTQATQQIRIASFHLEGDALQWYRWAMAANPMTTWPEFAKALLTCFGPTKYDDSAETLAKLQQVGSIREYQTEFEKLATQVSGLSEPFLISCFIGGLKEEICLNVKMFRPNSLTSAIGLARLQEERQNHHEPLSKIADKPTTEPAIPATPAAQKLPPVKRLTPAEAAERRRKQLCYNCDERWEAGHKCKQKTLFLIDGEDAAAKDAEEIFEDA
jgi:hypothetical protein